MDLAALDAAEAWAERAELARRRVHADLLRAALEVHEVYEQAGWGLSAGAHLAVLWSCSEWRAQRLLAEARQLSVLPGGLAAVEDGLLGVEQSQVLVEVLRPLDDPVAELLWVRLVERLRGDRERGVGRPPARVRELLQRWALQADPAGATERQRAAEAGG